MLWSISTRPVCRAAQPEEDRQQGADTAELHFDNVEVPVANLIGGENEAGAC